MGPAFITWADLRAWCEITGETLTSREAKLVMRLSALRVSIDAENTGAGSNGHSHQD